MSVSIIGPDGVARPVTVFTTTIPNRFFRGNIPSDTVDVQISIRGEPFTSNPDLIQFEGTTFSFPNPSAFPEGLDLVEGVNLIQVRAVSFSGAVSEPARLEVTLIQDDGLGTRFAPPTGISVEQFDSYVRVSAIGTSDPKFRGVNFFASRFQGGGSTGYQRVNVDAVLDFQPEEVFTTLTQYEADAVLKTENGSLAADPLYLELAQMQVSKTNPVPALEFVQLNPSVAANITRENKARLVKTDYIRDFEIPETARKLRSSVQVNIVEDRKVFSFQHHRSFGPSNNPSTVPIGEFVGLPNSEPLYYVTTAVYFDPEEQLEVQSVFSVEVYGRPTSIEQTIGTFPSISRLATVERIILGITNSPGGRNLDIKEGSVIRDTFVDPLSAEVIRTQILLDFFYRSQSFDTLLQIDGADIDEEPTPVLRSAYKQGLQRAFGITTPSDVQVLIDTTFEQLASRNNVFRRPGVRARGFVTFFTRNRPTSTVFLPIGTTVASGSRNFVTTADATIPQDRVASFFNPTTRQYSIDVPVQAVEVGASGNLTPGQIRTIVSSVPGFSVTNRNATFGGRDRDTNVQLANRARAALAGVDTGTAMGIRQVVADVAGVEDVEVVAAQDPLMQRDFDGTRHVGGKVDVWVRGQVIGAITDTFAFEFEVARDIQFVSWGNPANLVFKALDKTLSPENPIAEMLDDPSLGLGLRNASTGQVYNLQNVKILEFNLIELDKTILQPGQPSEGNVILGDYRYVRSRKFVFPRQPVVDVISVEGSASGVLESDQYRIVRTEDPLLLGRSVRAGDFLDIRQVGDTPAGENIQVTAERMVLIEDFPQFLNNLGANPLSIKVFNSERTVQYRGPTDPSGIFDYTIIQGDQTTPTAIKRVLGGQIQTGQTVSVDYLHGENFSVTYRTNFIVPTVQSEIDRFQHATADVLAKSMIEVPIDITATIVLQPGAQSAATDFRLKTNLASYFRSLNRNAAIRQSDLIAVMDGTPGVSHVIVPLTKMVRQPGSIVVRESIPSQNPSDTALLLGQEGLVLYSSPTVRVYLLTNPLKANTTTGGGPDFNFRGVFQDDNLLELLLFNPLNLKTKAGQAYIIGSDGLIIPGYSDDQTILNQSSLVLNDAQLEQERRNRTANRVMVSLPVNDRPNLYGYTVTYTVSPQDSGAKDIEGDTLEYFVPGDIVFTYTEDPRRAL